MNESRTLDPNSTQASAEVDQAISSIKANLSQPKDLVITEIVNYCATLQSNRGFAKLEEIFLMYLEKQSELPKLDNNVIDNLIELLILIIDRKSPSKTPRAFVLFARFMTNPEKLSGNDSIRDRFKYSQGKIEKLSLPIYIGNPIYKQWALALCVSFIENYPQASIHHFSNDPSHIELIRQAERNAMKNQLKNLLDQQAEDKEFITKAFAEISEKSIGLSRQVEELKSQIVVLRTGKNPPVNNNNNDTSAMIKNNYAYDNFPGNRALVVEEQERQNERIKGIEKRVEAELETIKKGMLRIEMQKGVQDASERDISDLKNDLDRLKHDFKSRKNADEIWNAALKKNNGAETGAIRDEISTLRIDLEMKIKQLEKGSLEYGKKEFLRLELKEGEIEHDLKVLKEKMIVMDKKFEVQMESKKKTTENYMKDQVLMESVQKEGRFVKEQQQVLTEILEKISKDIVDYKLTQNFEGEEIKRKLRSIEDEQKFIHKRIQEYYENPSVKNPRNVTSYLLLEDSPTHESGPQPKEGDNFYDQKPSTLGPQLSKLEENYRSQINRNVNNALTHIQRKLIEEMKSDFEAKLTIEKNANAFNKNIFDTEIESLKAKVTNIYERLDLSIAKDLQTIKTRVSFLEETDTYGPRIQNLSISLKALAKHLNIKVDYEKGEIQLLRESMDQIYIPPISGANYVLKSKDQTASDKDKDKMIELGLVDLVRGNLNRIADKLRVYHEIMNSLPDRTRTTSPLKEILEDTNQSYVALEKACDQVITLDELTMIVKSVTQKTNAEFTKLKEIIDDNVVAQNDYNISLADKLKDLEVAIESCQENLHSTQQELASYINEESNSQSAMDKRDLRQNLEGLNLRLEAISDHIKSMKDPISVRRLQTIISNQDSPSRTKRFATIEQGTTPGTPSINYNEELEERMGAMEFLMWRYARNFVEPEAQKKSLTIGKITVPVYEKLEHLMFLIKNCGFIQSKTIRKAIESFKNALTRLGRRCVQDKEEGFEEVWRIVKSSPDLNTEQYYYLMEVLYSLLSEERNNLEKAYQMKVFEFFMERLRKRDGSDPARACMLKILECLARTDAHMELIAKTNIFPEIVTICKPMIDGWETNPGQHMKLQAHEIKDQSDILELSEVDGLPSRTALLFYGLNLINEIIRNEMLIGQADLTYLIRSLLNLLKKPRLIKHVLELALIILYRIVTNTKGTYKEIFQFKENMEVLQNIALSTNVQQEIKSLADDLLQVIRDNSKTKSETNLRVSAYVPFHRIRARFGENPQPSHSEIPSRDHQSRGYLQSSRKTPEIERKRASFVVRSGNPKLPQLTKANKVTHSPIDIKTTKTTFDHHPRSEKKSEIRRRGEPITHLNYQPIITKTGLMGAMPRRGTNVSSKTQLNHRSSKSLLHGSRVYTESESRQAEDMDDRNLLHNRSFLVPGSHNDSSREEEFEETRKAGGLRGVKVMGRARGKLIDILNGKTTEETFHNNPSHTFRKGVQNPLGEDIIVPRLKIMDDPLSSLEIRNGFDTTSIEQTPYRY